MLNARCGVSRYNAMQRNDKWGQCEAEHSTCGWRSGPINWGARAGVGACMIILRNMRLNLIHIKETKSLLVLTFLTCTYFSYTEPIFVLMLCGRRRNDRHVDQMRANHIWSDNVGRWQSDGQC